MLRRGLPRATPYKPASKQLFDAYADAIERLQRAASGRG